MCFSYIIYLSLSSYTSTSVFAIIRFLIDSFSLFPVGFTNCDLSLYLSLSVSVYLNFIGFMYNISTFKNLCDPPNRCFIKI